MTSSTPSSNDAQHGPGLQERLASGPLVCAEGYLFELERRGYLQAGAFVPEVVLEHPEKVSELHQEFVHAGSDVVEAFTYYGHREKLRLIGKEHLLEPLNRQALELARRVARDGGALFAGDVCNTNVYDPSDPETHTQVRAMFEEQVAWAAEAGVDFVIGETFRFAGEASLALDVIRRAGLSAVITLVADHADETREGGPIVDACRLLADEGADVVGLNCSRGPATLLPLVEKIVPSVDVPVAALPVPYRTHDAEPTFQSLRDPGCTVVPDGMPFPSALDPFTCNRYEIFDFARQAAAAGATYLGLCCGAAPHHVRAVAEALGRTPPASRYSEDMSKHAYFGTDPSLVRHNLEYRTKL